jgi:Domain of unknown function (DUF4402)
MNSYTPDLHFIKLSLFFALTFLCHNLAVAQAAEPAYNNTVTATQPIQFGAFCVTGSSGGTITVAYDGTRTSTGDIVLLPTSPLALPATFELKLSSGKNISIQADATTIVSGSNGTRLRMDIGPTEKGPNGSVFRTDASGNSLTVLHVGGTLHIPGNSGPGNYSGVFNISFKEE